MGQQGGWVYIMANRYRGTMYVGVTSDLVVRVGQHRTGEGSVFCREKGLRRLVWAEHAPAISDAIAHEKRLKRWRREWKFTLIERGNPDWADLFDTRGLKGAAFHDAGEGGSWAPAQGRGDEGVSTLLPCVAAAEAAARLEELGGSQLSIGACRY